MKTAIYLRKSRQDEEAEKQGDDTLRKHRSTLFRIAKEKNLNVIEIKEEVVSGESVSYRPKMLELLEEVKSNKYDAVLVMDIDRLGRGNMQDQGLILETFKLSKTKIITPRKVYDLNNEFDEEYSEFEAFMARKELKLITRRLQRGRIKSIEDGKYIAQSPPFGYKFEFDTTGKKSMVIDEDRAKIVKLIYDMYIEKNGAYTIAEYLNSLGYKTSTGKNWYEKGVRDILKNKTYCGYVVWFKEERRKNKRYISSEEEQIEAKGLHEPIISEDIWNLAQDIRAKKAIPAVKSNKELTNPLASLIKCRECGHTMVAKFNTTKAYGYTKYIKCTYCKGVSGTRLELLEEEVLNALYDYLASYKISSIFGNRKETNSKYNALTSMLDSLKKEYESLLKQKENLHDLLEKGIYDVDTYLDRSRVVSDKIDENKESIKKLNEEIKIESENFLDIDKTISSLEHVLELYYKTDSIEEKNELLKGVLDKVIYYREPGRRKNNKFEIDLKIKLN